MDLIPDFDLKGVIDDVVDVVDDINIFDAIDDLNLLDGLGKLFDRLGDSLDDIDLGRFDGSDIIRGGLGSDIVRAAIGGNILLGLAGNDTLIGLINDNLLNGGAGRDTLKGLGGDDILTGLVGNDVLEGGKGDDLISGGKGLDRLFGGKGDDIFILEPKSGRDIIEDFDDKDDLLQFVDEFDFRDIGITQRDRDTVISFEGKTLAILKNIQSDQITAADFVNG